MKSFFTVGIGGIVGAICRYGLSLAVPNSEGFPSTTLCINLLGCFCLAWLFTTFTKRTPVVLGIGTGFCGAFTTYSTFSLETLLLVQQNEWLLAVLYVVISVVGGLVCTWLGIRLARGRLA
ncbi:fluoride efflux transporter CrcB [Lysinibacillus fusiformis]|uniref:fluoride efflux transporter CrcB n=1 Tax=Lysinibacillus fusiformis TaxID=28031 RepID=UPI00301A84EE